MAHNIDLILTLTGGLAAAPVLGYLTNRVGLSPIIGYLLAGIVVGPSTPGFVADRHMAEQLAEGWRRCTGTPRDRRRSPRPG